MRYVASRFDNGPRVDGDNLGSTKGGGRVTRAAAGAAVAGEETAASQWVAAPL